MSTSDSYVFQDAPHESSSEKDELDSLPSSVASSEVDLRGQSDAEREWNESLQQLELLLTMVVIPWVGKFFGRKSAYWGWAKYMEWLYPVEVRYTNESAFKAAGAVSAAVAL